MKRSGRDVGKRFNFNSDSETSDSPFTYGELYKLVRDRSKVPFFFSGNSLGVTRSLEFVKSFFFPKNRKKKSVIFFPQEKFTSHSQNFGE